MKFPPRRPGAVVLVLALAVAGAACGDRLPPAAGGPPARVVSLAPSVTEIVFALGAGDRLVGVCGECDHPPEAARLPRVGGWVVPSVEAVLAARPDVVFAVPSPGNHEAVLALERAGTRVEVVHDRVLADLWDAVRRIAAVLGVPARGEQLGADLARRLDEVHARVAGLPAPRVLVVVGHDPLIVVGGGTLQDELVRLAGGVNVAADAGTAWPALPLEVVVARAPDVIVDAAMGTDAGGRRLFARLTTVPAVRDGRVVALRDDAFLRAGPRVPDAAAELAELLHPGLARTRDAG